MAPNFIGQVTTRGGGEDWVSIKPGDTFKLPPIECEGYISYLWLTSTIGKPGWGNWVLSALKSGNLFNLLFYKKLDFLKKVRLRITFDEEIEPSIDVSVADFFGMGFGSYCQYDSEYVGMTSGGFYSSFEMPFKKSCKIEFINDNKDTVILYADATYRKRKFSDKKLGYFQASFNQMTPPKGEPYVVLNEEGAGCFLGSQLCIRGERILKHLSFLEGDVKFFIDNKDKPSLNYTGTEDYFLSGWYFVKGAFSADNHGCTYKSWLRRKISAYRFHPKKIGFEKNLRIEINHGENNEVVADYSSVAYWYRGESEKQ